MTEEWVRGTRPSGRPREEAVAPQNGAPRACNLSPAASFLLGVSSFPGEEQTGFVIGCFLQQSPQRCLSSARGSLLVHPLND